MSQACATYYISCWLLNILLFRLNGAVKAAEEHLYLLSDLAYHNGACRAAPDFFQAIFFAGIQLSVKKYFRRN